jgi:predicted RND superfamily exporter protein
MIAALTRLVTARPWGTLLTIVAFSAYLATGLGYSERRPVFEGELPETDWVVRETNEFKQRHPDRNFYAIGIEATGTGDVWNPRTLQKIAALSAAAARIPGALQNVQSLATWDHVVATADTVRVEPLMAEPPTDRAAIERLREVVEREPLLSGRLVSPDWRMALVRVTFAEDAKQSDVHAGLEQLRTRFEGPERIAIFGRHHLNQEIDFAVATHVSVLLPISIVLLLGFQYLCFGRWQAVWTTATLIGLTVVSYLGAIGLLRIPQSVVSSTVPVMLVVVLGSYVVHYLDRVYREAVHRSWPDAVRAALLHTAPPVALAAATTIAGFGSLVVFDIYSVREFGILAAAGVLIAGVLWTVWMPTALLVFARKAPPEHRWGRAGYLRAVAHISGAAAEIALHRPVQVRVATIAVLGLSMIGIAQLRAGSNPPEFFPAGHRVRDDFQRLLEHFGGDGFLSVSIEAPASTDAYEPAFLQRVAAFERDAARVDRVSYASSVASTVLARMHRKMHGDDPASEQVPDNRRLVAQYLELYRWDAPETLAEMIEDADPPHHVAVDLFANVNDSVAIASAVTQLRGQLDRHFAGGADGRAIFGGEWVLWTALNRYIVRGKILNVVSAIVLVALFCLLGLRSPRAAAAAVLPATLAAVLVFGVMGALGIRLDLASCVITCIVIGQGADFAVHLLMRHREIADGRDPDVDWTDTAAEAVRHAGPPILFNALSNAVAFGVFTLSPLTPVRDFGWLICLSMAACAATTLTLLPGLMGTRAVSSRTRMIPVLTLPDDRDGEERIEPPAPGPRPPAPSP